MTKILSGKALSDSQESLNLANPSSLLNIMQEERLSTVQNARHVQLLEETKANEGSARIFALMSDRQDESSSLDSMRDQNRIASLYSIEPDQSDPASTDRIRDLVSMLHEPSRMVHNRAGPAKGRKPPPGGEAPGNQCQQTGETGAAGSGPTRHSDLLEQTRMRALQRCGLSTLNSSILKVYTASKSTYSIDFSRTRFSKSTFSGA